MPIPADIQQYWVGGVHLNGNDNDSKQNVRCWTVRRQDVGLDVGTERQIAKRRSHGIAEDAQDKCYDDCLCEVQQTPIAGARKYRHQTYVTL